MNPRNFLALLLASVLLATATPFAARAAQSKIVSSGAVGGAATITFRKVFKMSYPEFVEIKLNESGKGTCDMRQLDEDPNVQPLEVGATEAGRIFRLAEQLHYFRGVNLDVHRRIASLGQKTFRYEKGSVANEVSFNYTIDENATQLLNIFEGLSRQESDLSDLQRTMRYDRLGVNDVLQQIEKDFDNKLLPEPERLLPSLDKLAADEKYIDIARQRARTLASRIRSGQ